MPFLSPLVLHSEAGEDGYTLGAPLVYQRPNGEAITVPAGFATDLASVPRLFWRVFPRDAGSYRAAAVVHDWLVGVTSWAVAADVFSEAMRDCGASWIQRKLLVGAVRFAGLWR